MYQCTSVLVCWCTCLLVYLFTCSLVHLFTCILKLLCTCVLVYFYLLYKVLSQRKKDKDKNILVQVLFTELNQQCHCSLREEDTEDYCCTTKYFNSPFTCMTIALNTHIAENPKSSKPITKYGVFLIFNIYQSSLAVPLLINFSLTLRTRCSQGCSKSNAKTKKLVEEHFVNSQASQL